MCVGHYYVFNVSRAYVFVYVKWAIDGHGQWRNFNVYKQAQNSELLSIHCIWMTVRERLIHYQILK